MATAKGQSGFIKAGDTTVGEVRSFVINQTCTIEDNTGIEQDWKEFFVTNTEWAADVSIFWDDANTALFPLGQEVSLTFVPELNTLTGFQYVGTGLVISRTITANYDTMVEASIRVIGVGRLLSQSQFDNTILDVTLVVDVPAKSFGRGVSDSLNLTEDQIIAIGKGITETTVVSENAALALAKYVADQAGISDLPSKNIGKVFAEVLGVTDDVDGEATVDDDQNIEFFKNTTNVTQVTDLLTRVVAYVRAFTETVGAADTPSLGVGKPFADSMTISEAIDIVLSKSVSLSDTVSSIDELAFAIAKSLTDTASVTDTPSKNVSKILADSANISDSDVIDFLAVKTDSATVSEAGSLISQGYVDNNFYFAEDYVGSSRNF